MILGGMEVWWVREVVVFLQIMLVLDRFEQTSRLNVVASLLEGHGCAVLYTSVHVDTFVPFMVNI